MHFQAFYQGVDQIFIFEKKLACKLRVSHGDAVAQYPQSFLLDVDVFATGQGYYSCWSMAVDELSLVVWIVCRGVITQSPEA